MGIGFQKLTASLAMLCVYLDAHPSVSSHRESRDAQQTVWQRLQALLARARAAAQPVPLSTIQPEPSPPSHAVSEQPASALAVCCLGPFRVYQRDQLVEEWVSRKGKSVFKYLISHRERPIPKEVLMDLFWPESSPEAARNNLNVAIYGLRQSLRQNRPNESHILYEDDSYLISPDLDVWVDAETFTALIASARQLEEKAPSEAVQEYHLAEALYLGDFLEEDRYEEWANTQRQQLKDSYLTVLEQLTLHYYQNGAYTTCVTQCRKALAVDPCRESAHRWIIQCYAQQGQRYLAIRQYQDCVAALRNELDMEPSDETVKLHEHILAGEKSRPSSFPQPILEFQGA